MIRLITHSTWTHEFDWKRWLLHRRAIPAGPSWFSFARQQGRVCDWNRCVLPANEPPIFNVKKKLISFEDSWNFRFHLAFALHLSCRWDRRIHQKQHDALEQPKICFLRRLKQQAAQTKWNRIAYAFNDVRLVVWWICSGIDWNEIHLMNDNESQDD